MAKSPATIACAGREANAIELALALINGQS